ncbi:metallo-beta-lactamase superfamily protein [Aspergillus uvarum CBS 121591]|uniref:Metallo-beta-lactamase superfamily protein n=1 Tax=Aspergillus uvarum CBS 121591 TaxID=1448315 RepID=A0A319CS71_9EURO|nr:metallo-beta-lactamase superfamily protein [Aspergillus uvarum CBS 121591]PYH87319.1 metallo-beta-lactamase superfamily protein [Aspergillus uvarum CBS 121591]
MSCQLQVDVYTAPPILIENGHSDPDKRWFSPICSTLVQGPRSAILIDTPISVKLSEDLVKWIQATAPGKELRYIYTTHAHADHFLGNPVVLRSFPEAKCVATSTVSNAIKKDWPESLGMWEKMFPGGQIAGNQSVPEPLSSSGEFTVDGHKCYGIDVPHSDTEASSFLHVPDLRLVVCGDIVYGDCYQFFGEAKTKQQRAQWLKALEQIDTLGPHIVVPGHKRATQANGPYLISATRDYILAFEEELAKSSNSDQLEQAMISRFPQRWNRFLLEWSCQSSIEEKGKN